MFNLVCSTTKILTLHPNKKFSFFIFQKIYKVFISYLFLPLIYFAYFDPIKQNVKNYKILKFIYIYIVLCLNCYRKNEIKKKINKLKLSFLKLQ